MIAAQLIALVLLVGVSCFAPGFLVVRRFRWDPIETFTASVGLSFVFLYLVTFGVFLAGLPPVAHFAITLLCVTACALALSDARRLFRSARLRQCLGAFLWLALWTIGTQLLIRHYSGGEQCCDWVEHYERSTHFVTAKPDDFRYLGRYLFTARPPFMNAICGHFLAQTGIDFGLYQVVFSLLNLFVYFPCALIVRLIARHGLRRFGLLAALFAANPMFFENTTFAWTKALAAGYVVLALWFYLAGLRRKDPLRVSAAFVSLAAGCLVHFSAAPFALFIGLHYLVAVWRLPHPMRALCAAVVPPTLLLVTWFAWAIGKYGVGPTFLSNTSVVEASGRGVSGNLLKIALNIRDTVQPHLFTGQPDNSPFRLLIDRAFMLYQVNLIFALGTVGCLVVIWLLIRGLGSTSALAFGERVFWCLFIPLQIIGGIATVGERIPSGVAHISLQALVYTAVALIATELPSLKRGVRLALGAGLLIDFALGVVLELCMEHSLERWAWSPNWDWKANEGLIYLGDRALVLAVPIALALSVGVLMTCRSLASTFLAPSRGVVQ